MSMARMRKRIYLTYPAKLVREPLVCRMYADLRVEFNLRTASVTDEIGIIGLELQGEPDEIAAAIEFFRSRGVRVEPIELDVVAG
jgi:ABC-type methionine transport system ATPase subunit